MKNLSLILILAFTLFSESCTDKSLTEENRDTALIENLEKKVAEIRGDNYPLIILKTRYCSDNDCNPLLKYFSKEVKLYSKEDAFMRNLNKTLEIVAFNPAQEFLQVLLEGKETIQIKL